MKNKKLLFSVTKDDCIMRTFRCGGNGGQRLNSTDTGVEFVHPPSGATGRSCDGRKQIDNKYLAWKRMAQSKAMQNWLRLEAARRSGSQSNIEEIVDQEMKNIKIEYFNGTKWNFLDKT